MKVVALEAERAALNRRQAEDRDGLSDQVRGNPARIDAEPRGEQGGPSESQSRRRIEEPAPADAAGWALSPAGRLIRIGDFTHPDGLPEAG